VSDATQYALLVVQAANDGDDCIGSTLGKLTRVSRIREIFIETLNKNFTEFLNVRKFREILHRSLLVSILESSNFTYGPLPFVSQLKCTLVTKNRQIISLQCQKNTHFTYLLNIDIVIFCKYRIDIVSKLKK